MKAQLEVVHGAKPACLKLRLPTVIGRSRDAKIKLRGATVSRQHCELYEYDGQLAVRDLGSSNGTIVNGHRIEGPTFLTADDQLTIGPVTLRATCDAGAAEHIHRSRAETDAAPATTSHEGPDLNSEPAPIDAETANVTDIPASAGDLSESSPSVLNYSESSEGSFVDIGEMGEAPAAVDDIPTVDTQEGGEKPKVNADDSTLNAFLEGLN